MHKLMAGGTILEHELSDLRLLVERQAGILLDCPNSALAAHVADYLDAQDLQSAAAVLERLRSADQDPTFLPHFLDGVVNTSTGFFRHPGAMGALTRQVLPQLFARKSGDNPAMLRMWSAGCATGEEAYSIAMAACTALAGNTTTNTAGAGNGNGSSNLSSGGRNSAGRNGGISDACVASQGCPLPPGLQQSGMLSPGKDWTIHIVGSDLLPSAIEVAERGLYPQSSLVGLPPATIRACFSKIGSTNASSNSTASVSASDLLDGDVSPSVGNTKQGSRKANGFSSGSAPTMPLNGSTSSSHLLVKPRLRNLVTFNTMNLTRPVYIGRFDCIFCMDVLPHLSRTQRTALLERLSGRTR